MTAAATTTTSRLGPSGSLKKKNITLEQTRDVTPKSINEAFCDLKYIDVSIVDNLRASSKVSANESLGIGVGGQTPHPAIL